MTQLAAVLGGVEEAAALAADRATAAEAAAQHTANAAAGLGLAADFFGSERLALLLHIGQQADPAARAALRAALSAARDAAAPDGAAAAARLAEAHGAAGTSPSPKRARRGRRS